MWEAGGDYKNLLTQAITSEVKMSLGNATGSNYEPAKRVRPGRLDHWGWD